MMMLDFLSGHKDYPFVIFSVLMIVYELVFELSFKLFVLNPGLLILSCVALLLLFNDFDSLISKQSSNFVVSSSEELNNFLIIEEMLPLA